MDKQTTSLSIIEDVSLTQVQNTLNKIAQFQELVHSQLKQNQDYGIIPGTPKPTLLKPGAEKIIMLMGLRSEFDIVDSTRDFDKGFFEYQVKCKLYKGDYLITEGLGAGNTRERKYIKQDPFSVDNTILKMAKKRALVDATLLVASLSEVFSQDLEDVDITGEHLPQTQQERERAALTPDSTDTISTAQAKRMFALSKGNADLCKQILHDHGYEKSADVKKLDYEIICKRITELAGE